MDNINRRTFLRRIAESALAASFGSAMATHSADQVKNISSPNILFIAIDDLNDWVGCYKGHPQVQTPFIDSLAKRGTIFTEAHCPAPVCGPSRAAIMSGMATVRNGVYSNNASYPKRLPDAESMPEYLRRHGYRTLGAGKLFHGGNKYPEGAFDDYAPKAEKPYPSEALLSSKQTPVYEFQYGDKIIKFPLNGMRADRVWRDKHSFDWGPLDLPDHEFLDAKTVAWAIKRLKKPLDKPLFLGVGFHLPHQPLYAPKRFHDLYPPDTIVLPPVKKGDLDDLSEAGKDYALIPATAGKHASVVKHKQWKNAVSSYLATVSFVDHLIGRLLVALDSSPLKNNTWIVLWSDHGYHLGEKEHWGKATGWYRATRVPLMIIPPKAYSGNGFKPGSHCDLPVNLLDLFPTITEIAGLPRKEGLDGNSLLPLLKNPKAKWAKHTVTTFGRGNHAITTERWRYIQYFDGTSELYDRRQDPNEWTNLAGNPEYRKQVERMQKHVPPEPQYKHFIRYGHFKAVIPVDGSEMLLYNHERENHIEERDSEAKEYPHVVAAIKKWLKENPHAEKRVVIGE